MTTAVDKTEEILLDLEGWREEAKAVINDVKDFVKRIAVSEVLEVKRCFS